MEYLDYLPNAKPFKTVPTTLSLSNGISVVRATYLHFQRLSFSLTSLRKFISVFEITTNATECFLLFHLHLPNCPFPSNAPSSLPWFFCLSFGSRKKKRQEDSKALALPCLMGVVKRRYWNQLNSTSRKYRFFFCGPVWHLNRVICFGVIWMGGRRVSESCNPQIF